MTGQTRFLNEPNSETYEDRTRRFNSEIELGAAGGAPQARPPSSWGAGRSIVGVPARLSHSALPSAGSLTRLTARSPASEGGPVTNSRPFAGKAYSELLEEDDYDAASFEGREDNDDRTDFSELDEDTPEGAPF